MKNTIIIPNKDGTKKYFDFRFNQYISSRRIYVEDVCIIEIYKFNDHNYRLKYFFYKTKQIGFVDNIQSKKKTFEQIQFALEQNVYKFVQ